MGKMSRTKGAVGKRELSEILNRKGILCHRTAQRRGDRGGAADIEGDGLALHIEVKRQERLRLAEWMAQAQRDAHGQPFAVMHRANGGEWLVTMRLDEWVEDSKACELARAHRQAVLTQVTDATL